MIDPTLDQSTLSPNESAPAVAPDDEGPEFIGRYRVKKVLGRGGFGLVYLAEDQQLNRPVAIKVPHAHLVRASEDADAYLTEARTVAALDHPNIVPVFDVGSSERFPCFVVSKYIDGANLVGKLKQSRLSLAETVDIVATIAEALHYAHKAKLVHRDIKPANILIDRDGKPYVGDFGLALKEENFGKGGHGICGTPAYMSPEQAKSEGHRVDGRSDIFSLGVVFYEMLVGRRPFHADSVIELLEQIVTLEARPPRMVDDRIPRELDRICLKALSKRATERYSSASDMADDLRHFLAGASITDKSSVTGNKTSAASVETPAAGPTPTPQHDIKIVPKGLRSFDAADADFFLDLLPGPRDRDGLPDSIRFWKNRIENTTDGSFTVGLVYGPSGCGKSSLMKAGLLPRLAKSMLTVYIEATPDDTETRLLKGLQRRVPGLPGNLGLIESLNSLRTGQYLNGDQKIVLVLDQFEQWLHAKRNEDNTELVQALRQCDGGRLQCIVMVRDDFWLAVSRFMQALEIRVVEGENSRLVDLFDLRHARKVLSSFGKALGPLPEGKLEKEQESFLDQAVAGLAQEGKIISVRLALFAEMVKGKPWTPGTLKQVGGIEGVGVTFLEETFTANTAPPLHRVHQKAAQAVLKALLPAAGSDIKGHMKSQAELLEASGYASKTRDFDELLRVLDSEVRLITPTDTEVASVTASASFGFDATSGLHSDARNYQLTHDYLVPSLRDWLTRKQKETRKGRAELLLADRAAVWNARPENRQLPSLRQSLSIRWLTAKKDWTPPQRKMMRQCKKYHAVRGIAAVLILAIIGLGTWEGFGRLEGRRLRDRLLEATTMDVPSIVKDMAGYRRWVDPLLQTAYAQSEQERDQRKQLHASLAMLPVDAGQVDYLYKRALKAEAQEIVVIREALMGHSARLTSPLWTLLENPQNDRDERFRAACVLAHFSVDDTRWEKVGGDVAATLVIQKPFVIAQWSDVLQGVGRWLIPSLADFLVDEQRSVAERGLIASVYGKYAAAIPDAHARLEEHLAESRPTDATVEAKLALAKKQASIGIALLVMGPGEKVWPLLKHSPDPTVRSFLIERLGQGGVDARMLLARLDEEKDTSIRRAILLSLGEYGLDRLPPAERQNLLPRLLGLYRDDPDPGIHGAARWLLRKWEAAEKIKEIEAAYRLTSTTERKRGWSINSQGQTMVLVPKPNTGIFWMGEGEERHQQPLGHDVTISADDVTVEQFQRFRAKYKPDKRWAPTTECPAIEVSWFDAAAYCNWLSEREGIAEAQWCYEPNKDGKYAEGMKIKDGYLRLQGYRLPTETEWEHACRAGSTVGYGFGGPAELLERYAWFVRNSLGQAHPVGLLKPNDLGLFDMHGNVWKWTQDSYKDKVTDKDDDGRGGVVDTASYRVNRGGSWDNDAGNCRAASRNRNTPVYRNFLIGFRLARVPVEEKGKQE